MLAEFIHWTLIYFQEHIMIAIIETKTKIFKLKHESEDIIMLCVRAHIVADTTTLRKNK